MEKFRPFLSVSARIDISVAPRKIALIISDSIETDSSVETEIVRVVSLSPTEITEITRFKKPILRVRIT